MSDQFKLTPRVYCESPSQADLEFSPEPPPQNIRLTNCRHIRHNRLDIEFDFGQREQPPGTVVQLGYAGLTQLRSLARRFECKQNDSLWQSETIIIQMKEEERKEVGLQFTQGLDIGLYRRVAQDEGDQPILYTTLNLLPGSPNIEGGKQTSQKFHQGRENLLNQCIRRQIQRVCQEGETGKRMVYDSVRGRDEGPWLRLGEGDTTLLFQSRFQSGNLRRAIQYAPCEYFLILRPDSCTESGAHWFYFSVANTRKNKEYRIAIVNLVRPDCEYNAGMRPAAYSLLRAARENVGWHRTGQDICYFSNAVKRKSGKYYFTLEFKLKFEYDYDTVYLAAGPPASYTRLASLLRRAELDPQPRPLLQRRQLCQTVAGNSCEYITITDPASQEHKRGVFVMSRVHPGEVNSSHFLERIIQFLISAAPAAQRLRQLCVIRIIPMLNPDGVVNGNYKTDLLGCDLSRQWAQPSKKLHPTIYHAKALIKRTHDEVPLIQLFDLHGTCMKRNVTLNASSTNKLAVNFALLLREYCPGFSFKQCNFSVGKGRNCVQTLGRQFGVNACSLNISNQGSDVGKYEGLHFNRSQFEEMGRGWCQSLLELLEMDEKKIDRLRAHAAAEHIQDDDTDYDDR